MPKYERRIILCTPTGQDIQSIPWNGVPYPHMYVVGNASFKLIRATGEFGVYLMEVSNGTSKQSTDVKATK